MWWEKTDRKTFLFTIKISTSLIFGQISVEGQTVNIDCRQRRDFIPVFQFKSHFPLAPRLTDPQWSCKGQKFIVKHILLTGPVAVPGQEYSYNKMTLLSKRNCAITQPWWEGQKFTILISIHLQVLMTILDKGSGCQDTFTKWQEVRGPANLARDRTEVWLAASGSGCALQSPVIISA